VRAGQTEGPYFVDERLNRSDIRSEPGTGAVKQGVPLRLMLQVNRGTANACSPLAGAIVDIWQCDALGVYSDVRDTAGMFDTRGQKFLRGYQVTGSGGAAEFITIYPGWYPGRTVHIHFKVRTSLNAGAYEFTSQLYFDDALTDQVHLRSPYSTKGRRTTTNSGDGIYRNGGSQLLLAPVAEGDGYAATFALTLQVP
jgi:protocatechuate 3,4-dioxygenase beta subunit